MTDVQESQAAPFDLAQSLVDSGAQPTQIDANALLSQIQKLQSQVDSLNAERGIPSDPVAAKIQALAAHLKVQANANPAHAEAYADALTHSDTLKSESINPSQSDKMHRLVSRLVKKLPQHELSYVTQLAEELHDMVSDKANA